MITSRLTSRRHFQNAFTQIDDSFLLKFVVGCVIVMQREKEKELMCDGSRRAVLRSLLVAFRRLEMCLISHDHLLGFLHREERNRSKVSESQSQPTFIALKCQYMCCMSERKTCMAIDFEV